MSQPQTFFTIWHGMTDPIEILQVKLIIEANQALKEMLE